MFIIHGLADDNVLVAHSLRLSSALLAAGYPHSVLPLSGVTHMTPQETVAENMLMLQVAFLKQALGLPSTAIAKGLARVSRARTAKGTRTRNVDGSSAAAARDALVRWRTRRIDPRRHIARDVARELRGGSAGRTVTARRGAGAGRPRGERRGRARAIAAARRGRALLFLGYLRVSWTVAATSDGAALALQARDMLAGNWLLHGWTLSDVSFYTTELPEYVLVEAVRPFGLGVIHVAAAATYTLLVLAAFWLARGRAAGREGLARGALAAVIMVAPQLGYGAFVLLLSPDQSGRRCRCWSAGCCSTSRRAAGGCRRSCACCWPWSSSPTGSRC